VVGEPSRRLSRREMILSAAGGRRAYPVLPIPAAHGVRVAAPAPAPLVLCCSTGLLGGRANEDPAGVLPGENRA
jgi:hypothetical protein